MLLKCGMWAFWGRNDPFPVCVAALSGLDSEGQSAAIPVASMEFAAICLRNALLLLPEHQPQDVKAENNSRTASQSGSTESGSENSDVCRLVAVPAHTPHTRLRRRGCVWLGHLLLVLCLLQWERSGG